MPRQQNKSNLCDVITYRRIKERYTTDELSSCIGIQPNTYFRRLRNPEQFHLDELQELSKRLNLSITISNGTVTATCEL